MGGEESNNGGLRVESKSVIVQVDGVEVWMVKDRGKQQRDSFWDFGKESACEDVGKVGNLQEMGVSFLVFRRVFDGAPTHFHGL